jgi:hypothetical protein
VRADTHKNMEQKDLIEYLRDAEQIFNRRAITPRGVDIVEHAVQSFRTDFHVVVRMFGTRNSDGPRSYTFMVTPFLAIRKSFQRFLQTLQSYAFMPDWAKEDAAAEADPLSVSPVLGPK